MEKSTINKKLLDFIKRKFRSECTVKVYSSLGTSFIKSKHPNSLECLSTEYLQSYLDNILHSKSVSSYNQMMSVIKIIYREVLKKPRKVSSLKPLQQQRKLKKLPTFKELSQKISSIKNIKHKAIILTLLSTGVRISELLNIKISDIDSEKMTIRIERGKGGRSRIVPLADDLLNVLRIYYSEHRPHKYLFEGTNGIYSKTSVNKVVKRNIGGSFHAHTFRHVFVSYLVDKDVNIKRLKNMTGHLSDKSLEWYVQFSESSIEKKINPLSELKIAQ